MHERFRELFESHGPALMAMLRGLLRSTHDAEEVFQETAIRVWKDLRKAPLLRNPRAWLMTIGYRSAIDARRARHNPTVHSPAVLDSESCHDPGPPPDRLAEQREMNERVTALLDDLPPALREVVVLHYTGGLTLRATAKAMGLPVGTAKSRLNQALQTLRQRLS